MKAKEYLKENPKCDVIHSTSDGTLFYAISDAKNYAKTLKDDKVTTDHQTQKEEDNEDKSADSNAPVPYNKRNNDLLKALMVERGIEFDEAGKKAEFVSLLEASDLAALKA